MTTLFQQLVNVPSGGGETGSLEKSLACRSEDEDKEHQEDEPSCGKTGRRAKILVTITCILNKKQKSGTSGDSDLVENA